MSGSSGPWRSPAQSAKSAEAAASSEEPAVPPPEDIHTAWVLWLAATGLALVGMLLNAATTRFGDLPAATRDAFRDAVDTAGTTEITVETLFVGALVVGAVLAVLVSALTLWLAFRLRAGKGWARTMLDIVAIFLVVDAVSVVIGVFGGVAVAGQRGEATSFVVFSLQILAGLCAATAVWRQHTAEATSFTSGGARAGQ